MSNRPAFPGVSRNGLSHDVAEYVRERILTGQVKKGEFIRIHRLADDLGISVTPVREGLLALQGEGFVELIPRRGFAVRGVTTGDIGDMYWIQAQIESELTRRATTVLSTADITTLVQIQSNLERAATAGDHAEVARLNHEFHRLITTATDNSRLRWFLGTITRMAPGRLFGTVEGWTEAAVAQHGAIIDALQSRNSSVAADTMRDHVINAGAILADQLASQLDDD